MPCYITGSELGDAHLSAQEAHNHAQEVTRMLCETMARLETAGRLSLASKQSRVWWTKHKAIDAERKAAK